MKIYVDADGCPVVNITIELAKQYDIPCILVTDTSHEFHREGATTITVSKGADSVDFALVNLLSQGDVVITQDYGLAAMCLAKKTSVIRQDGVEYTSDNIDALLSARHQAKKIRRSGGRLHGASKRSENENIAFRTTLERILSGGK